MTEAVSEFSVKKVQASRLAAVDFENLQFGKIFADHMFVADFVNGDWTDLRIEPFGKMEVSPALNVFHYGQAIFEGMKAYYIDEDTVHLFRPRDHHERFTNSCIRMMMPPISYDIFIKALEELIRLDFQWIPRKSGSALYLRPFMISNDDWIAARVSEKYRFFIINCPVGHYYKEGANPVKLTTPKGYVRAVKGGTGFAKAAGNYAASFYPAKKAQDTGFTQVLWLDAKEHRFVEEVGTMNIFFVMGNSVVTPALSGSILPGITRSSVLTLAADMGYTVEERPVEISELFEAYKKGMLTEVFGTGTAAVISPVGLIEHDGETMHFGDSIGEVAQSLYTKITDIQYGLTPDEHQWVQEIKISG